MGNQEAVAKAIHERLQIHADYDGKPRQLCPHTLGYKDGVMQCLFYQFGGQTSQGALPQDPRQRWRCMLLSKLLNVRLESGQWHTAPNYKEEQSCIDEIILAV